MKTICLYFQVHQPFRLKRYRFFDIGKDHFYYDDFSNKSILRKVAEKCYLPANQLMLDLIKTYGKRFKISYSLSGVLIEQLKMYAPEVLESFVKLAKTGCVEFLGETYSHSLASLQNNDEFEEQIKKQNDIIEELFGKRPTIFRNTELIYSDEIGKRVAKLGYKAVLAEGAKQILGWRSPNFIYTNAIEPKLKVLLRNFRLSDDIAFRFSNRGWSEWPLTAEKFVAWLNDINTQDEIVNLFMDYETFGEHQHKETGIFDFLRELPHQVFKDGNFEFLTPSQVVEKHQPVSSVHVPHPVSWADEERDLSAWLGNELQDEAYSKISEMYDKVLQTNDDALIQTWRALQTSDHFYYMCTKWFSDGDVHSYFNPYDTPYEAFINYMNVISDFELMINKSLENPKPKKITKAAATKKSAVKKVASKKSSTTTSTKKTAVKKAEPKKAKVAEKKVTTKKSASKKTVTAKAAATKKTTAKKTEPKKEKGTEKKATTKKIASEKTTKTKAKKK